MAARPAWENGGISWVFAVTNRLPGGWRENSSLQGGAESDESRPATSWHNGAAFLHFPPTTFRPDLATTP